MLAFIQLRSLSTGRQIGKAVLDDKIGNRDVERCKMIYSNYKNGNDGNGKYGNQKTTIVDDYFVLIGYDYASCERKHQNAIISLGAPLIPTTSLVCDSTIYNHDVLTEHYKDLVEVGRESGNNPISYLCNSYFSKFMAVGHVMHLIDGKFSFVATHKDSDGQFLVARDAFGLKPLWYLLDMSRGLLCFASCKDMLVELARECVCADIKEFPAGHFMTQNSIIPQRWYLDLNKTVTATNPPDKIVLRHTVQTAILNNLGKTNLGSCVKIYALLSGGLCSSIMAAVASSILQRRGIQLNTVFVGPDGEDANKAQQVAAYIRSNHIRLDGVDYKKVVMDFVSGETNYVILSGEHRGLFTNANSIEEYKLEIARPRECEDYRYPYLNRALVDAFVNGFALSYVNLHHSRIDQTGDDIGKPQVRSLLASLFRGKLLPAIEIL